MVSIAVSKSGRLLLSQRVRQYEYEIILLLFLVLRFIFKNLPNVGEYFTFQPIFKLSVNVNITIGVIVLLAVILLLSSWFGTLIKINGSSYEKPILFLIALFFASPASLPFLFSTASTSGSTLLYPFALFVFSIFFAGKPVFKWLLPFICAAYYIPAAHSTEAFFIVLRKGAVLYIPLILMYLFLTMMKPGIMPGKKKYYVDVKSTQALLFILCSLSSLGSYIYTILLGNPYYKSFFNFDQHLDGYFFVALLIAAPAAAAVLAVIRMAIRNRFPAGIVDVFINALVFLFLFFRNNFTGLWIPFLLLSLFMLVFYAIQHKNPAMLAATVTSSLFFEKHRILFFFILMTTSSLSSTSSPYLANIIKTVFINVPY